MLKLLNGVMGWLNWQSVEFEIQGPGVQTPAPSGAQVKFGRVFPSQKCCADSLSVCPTPVCIHTHMNDQLRTLKIMKSMSEFGGLQMLL